MLQRPAAGAVLGLALCALVCGSAQAQGAFPVDERSRMVVPFPAGGTADLLCRYAAREGERDARPAGGDREPARRRRRPRRHRAGAACAAGRLHAAVLTQLSYSITHLVFTKAAFDPRPLEPISVLATYPLVILTRKPILPANNLEEFIAYAKATARSTTATRAWPTPGICSAS